jgi:hypothetical protein
MVTGAFLVKAIITLAVACISGAACAQLISKPSNSQVHSIKTVDKAALDERMGQLQLGMLIDSVLQQDASARGVRQPRANQSAQR